jgi:poly(3-hydroxybutyrate) depolymerase
MMQKTLRGTLLCLTTALAGTAAHAMDCNTTTAESLGLSGVRLTDVAKVAAGEESPVPICRIRGVMAERTGADGQPYALRFELSLPDDWNGDYVHQFNGGNDGEVKPATGALQAGTGTSSPLARGFAVVSSDAGHAGDANKDAGLAGGARFGFDFKARQMYGYGAVALLDPVARAATEAYYATPIGHSFGIGCSNGGRHAMVAAARMPEAFDGLLIGAPGFNLPKAAVQHALDVQSFHAVSDDLKTAFSRADLAVVAQGIRNSCDALDGLQDGLVEDTAACQKAFDVSTLQCSAAGGEGCISAAQVTALKTIFAGPKGADGTALYSDWAWDPGIEGGNWRMWKLESPIAPWDNKPIIAVMGAASLAQVFTTPPTRVDGAPEALEGFLQGFDIPAQASEIYATSGDFPESPMTLMSPPGSDNPDLAAFRDAGGKMMIYHGVADPVFSERDTANWYAKLDANNGGKAGDFVQFYPVPGMNHCIGGPAADEFDLLTQLVDWVEKDAPPVPAIAKTRADNKDLPAELQGISRPLCSAPLVARYQGGDAALASSFTCQP